MKSIASLAAATILAGGALSTAHAGQCEWSTASKILTGIVGAATVAQAFVPPQPVYAAPAPVVIAQPAPAVVYAPPAPQVIYTTPRVIVGAPAVVVARPDYYV